MDNDKIIELFFYTLPALITGAVAYFFFQGYLQNDEKRRHFMLVREGRKSSLPLKLQAYERLSLFIERIDPGKILLRVTPQSDDKNDYVNLVAAHIDQEYEHNLAQQIYISDDCWGIITTAKNATIQMLRKAALNGDVADADQLRENVLSNLFENGSPSNTAIAFIKNEVRELI